MSNTALSQGEDREDQPNMLNGNGKENKRRSLQHVQRVIQISHRKRKSAKLPIRTVREKGQCNQSPCSVHLQQQSA